MPARITGRVSFRHEFYFPSEDGDHSSWQSVSILQSVTESGRVEGHERSGTGLYEKVQHQIVSQKAPHKIGAFGGLVQLSRGVGQQTVIVQLFAVELLRVQDGMILYHLASLGFGQPHEFFKSSPAHSATS